MKPKPKSTASIFGLAFMDCICCGFGAVILLLIINKGVNQGAIEESAKVNESILRKVQDEIAVIRGESIIRNIELEGIKEQLSEEDEKVARLKEQEFETKAQFAANKDLSEIIAEKRALFDAKQKRDELRKTPPAWKTDVVGGIPADSEYVIFIIDTSGSMKSIARTVAEKLRETLAVYPKIKGMQIMNADGRYMKPQSAGGWLPATTRKDRIDILQSYVNWRDNSSSTPVGGLIEALGRYSKSNEEISIYVFGDDFTGNIDFLVQKVDEYNPVRSDGRKMIRIHGVGFPSAFGHDSRRGGGKFAKAMRTLAERNAGAFVTITR